jgi:hypothetical protein
MGKIARLSDRTVSLKKQFWVAQRFQRCDKFFLSAEGFSL